MLAWEQFEPDESFAVSADLRLQCSGGAFVEVDFEALPRSGGAEIILEFLQDDGLWQTVKVSDARARITLRAERVRMTASNVLGVRVQARRVPDFRPSSWRYVARLASGKAVFAPAYVREWTLETATPAVGVSVNQTSEAGGVSWTVERFSVKRSESYNPQGSSTGWSDAPESPRHYIAEGDSLDRQTGLNAPASVTAEAVAVFYCCT